MSRLKERLTLVGGLALAIVNRLLLQARLRRRVDGWRRGAGLVLRGEAATFVLSAFSLDVWSDDKQSEAPSIGSSQEHIAARLATFLAREPDCHVCIRRGELEDRVEPCGGPSYSLAFQPWIDGPARFIRPDTWMSHDQPVARPDAADVLFNIVCRIGPSGITDVWVRVNHIGLDGVPAQEIMSRLEAEWGTSNVVEYPAPEAFARHEETRPCRGRAELCEVQTFVDFGPLLKWRAAANARMSEPMTVAAAVMWCLARHPAFPDIRIGSTVEMPAVDGLGRGVGIVVARPAEYFGREDGLARYVREFNRQLALTRRRASGGCKTLDAVALIPPKMAATLLQSAMRGERAFGAMGLTVLRDAKVFGAPIGDVGHPDGFMAIGNVALPGTDGRRVGCVAIKGPPERISRYPAVIREAIQACSAGLS